MTYCPVCKKHVELEKTNYGNPENELVHICPDCMTEFEECPECHELVCTADTEPDFGGAPMLFCKKCNTCLYYPTREETIAWVI